MLALMLDGRGTHHVARATLLVAVCLGTQAGCSPGECDRYERDRDWRAWAASPEGGERYEWNLESSSPCLVTFECAEEIGERRPGLRSSSVSLLDGADGADGRWLVRLVAPRAPLDGTHWLFLVLSRRGGSIALDSYGLFWTGGDVVGGEEWRPVRGRIGLRLVEGELLASVGIRGMRGVAVVDLSSADPGLLATLDEFRGAPRVPD